jgi:AcrR family transcriptional regulator
MSPRRYRLGRRAEAKADTRERIVAAAVELHREKGTVATSYADLAERAGVSLQTVHNHFPTLGELLPACTGMVAATAPQVTTDVFEHLAAPKDRLDALLKALLLQHAHFEPWMRWAVHEARLVPELGAGLRQGRDNLAALVAKAVAPGFAGKPPAEFVALLATWLDIECWMRLQSQSGLNAKAASAALRQGALALLHRYLEIAPSPIKAAKRDTSSTKGERS